METLKQISYDNLSKGIDSLPINEINPKMAEEASKTNYIVTRILEGNNNIDKKEVLGNTKEFNEFIEEQFIATDLSRIFGKKPGAMLKEQLTALGLYNKQLSNNINYKENQETQESSFFGAPNKTIPLVV